MKTQIILLLSLSSLILSLAPGDSVVDKTTDTLTYSNPTIVFDKSTLVVDRNKIEFDDKITSKQVMDEMGFGWNLGNTFDAWTK